MTDEELAEEWVKQEYPTLQLNAVAQRYIKAFLAGLKAGRPKWFKPSEKLPPVYSTVFDENGDKVEYIGYGKWQVYSECYERNVEVDAPIALCEIPKYTEE